MTRMKKEKKRKQPQRLLGGEEELLPLKKKMSVSPCLDGAHDRGFLHPENYQN